VKLPRLYAIVDIGMLTRRGVRLREFAEGLRDAGVTLVQLRDKQGSPAEVLAEAGILREVFRNGATLVMNDRADLAVLAGFDGVHVGQGDQAPEDARVVLSRGGPTHRLRQEREEWGTRFVVGVSTHSDAQVLRVGDADYIAVGPVFATGTKADAEPVVGLEGVRRARALTDRPLVAIGGITRENCRDVVDAGADSVAVISGLIVSGEPVAKVARDFLRILN
jgi:thiamine-phosphate pyrophosphorylase